VSSPSPYRAYSVAIVTANLNIAQEVLSGAFVQALSLDPAGGGPLATSISRALSEVHLAQAARGDTSWHEPQADASSREERS
jgi:hypothetical protein